MTVRKQPRVFIPPQFVAVPPEELRLLAAASGQEAWEQLGRRDAYACRDFPGVVLTRAAARARPHAFLMHAAIDADLASTRRG